MDSRGSVDVAPGWAGGVAAVRWSAGPVGRPATCSGPVCGRRSVVAEVRRHQLSAGPVGVMATCAVLAGVCL